MRASRVVLAVAVLASLAACESGGLVAPAAPSHSAGLMGTGNRTEDGATTQSTTSSTFTGTASDSTGRSAGLMGTGN